MKSFAGESEGDGPPDLSTGGEGQDCDDAAPLRDLPLEAGPDERGHRRVGADRLPAPLHRLGTRIRQAPPHAVRGGNCVLPSSFNLYRARLKGGPQVA